MIEERKPKNILRDLNDFQKDEADTCPGRRSWGTITQYFAKSEISISSEMRQFQQC